MNKRYLHHIYTRIRPFKAWYFLLAAVLCGVICAVALRSNYQHMTKLKQAVYVADQNNGNVEQTLQNLRSFVASHMNTNLADTGGVYPPIQLKYTYARLQQAEKDRVASVMSQIYPDAQRTCEEQYPGSFSGGPRVPCIEQYVKDHGTTERTIPAAKYKFDFASARFSSDLAGWSMVIAIVCACLGVLRIALGFVLQKFTR